MAFGKVAPKATTFISQGWDAFNTLIDDIKSVSNGKGASQVGIEDAADNMTATNVEDALAEIYSDTATTVTLAETFAENSATTTGLTWGYKGGLFRLDAIVTDVAAGTIGLTDDAINYIEIDPLDGNVKKNTTSFTSGRIPIRQVTTVSGSQTVSTDKRAWFSQVAAGTLVTAGINNLAISGSTKTDAYTVTTSDAAANIILGSATSANKIFTLPSVGSAEDGMPIGFYNDSNFKLTIQPSDTDSVWNSGAGYGIQTIKEGAYVTLRYDHSTTSWQSIQIGGGMWMVENLNLCISGTSLTIVDVDASTTEATTPDKARRHFPTAIEGVRLGTISFSSFASLLLNGTDEYISIADSDDWDIFGSLIDDRFVMIRVRFDNAASGNEYIFSNYEDSSNNWRLFRTAAGVLKLTKDTGGVQDISLTGSTVMGSDTWYTVAIGKVAGVIGIYLGTSGTLSIEAYDEVWAADTFTGALVIGQSGADTSFVDGRIQDILIANQNLVNALPDAGLTDTIEVPTRINYITGGN